MESAAAGRSVESVSPPCKPVRRLKLNRPNFPPPPPPCTTSFKSTGTVKLASNQGNEIKSCAPGHSMEAVTPPCKPVRCIKLNQSNIPPSPPPRTTSIKSTKAVKLAGISGSNLELSVPSLGSEFGLAQGNLNVTSSADSNETPTTTIVENYSPRKYPRIYPRLDSLLEEINSPSGQQGLLRNPTNNPQNYSSSVELDTDMSPSRQTATRRKPSRQIASRQTPS
ncbi:hypothetical protein O0L34_g11476 [Tuta absoluta]|nr:hypothetical protein O0L34_g11476 [Tuta absoluta]